MDGSLTTTRSQRMPGRFASSKALRPQAPLLDRDRLATGRLRGGLLPVGKTSLLVLSDQHAGVTSNYTYDPLYELTQVTQAANTTESYTYDPVGNRLSSLGVSPYTNNSSNELTSTPSASYAYDYNGNDQPEFLYQHE